jgi:hypothetical protein
MRIDLTSDVQRDYDELCKCFPSFIQIWIHVRNALSDSNSSAYETHISGPFYGQIVETYLGHYGKFETLVVYEKFLGNIKVKKITIRCKNMPGKEAFSFS